MFRVSYKSKGLSRGKVFCGVFALTLLLGAGFYLRHSFDEERAHELAALVVEHLDAARAEARVEVMFAEDGSVYLVENEAPESHNTDLARAEIDHQIPSSDLENQELNRALAEEILKLTNQERAKHGLSPLARHQALEHAAADHSQEMRDLNYFSHTSPTPHKATARQRVNRYGVNPQLVAENIFECSGYDVHLTSKFAVEAFMQSPGHRQNVLNPTATHIGVGFAATDGSVSVTQVFGAGL